MRSPLLALLPVVFAVVLAPTAPVRMVEKKVAAKKADAPDAATLASDKQAPAPAEDRQKRRAPPRAQQWSELTPVYPTGDGPTPDTHEPGLCPEPAPALAARRLPVVLRFSEPPTEPDRASLRSGLLALPPPVA